MPVSKFGKQLFICLERDISSLHNLAKKLGRPIHKNGLAMWFSSCIELSDDIGIDNKSEVLHLLDKFHILVPIKDTVLRKELFDRFFGLIADEYETLIDIDRNKENIKNLLRLVEHYLGNLKEMTVVDYGCGTGLSLDIAENHGLNIIGFDPCRIMLDIAKQRGMTIWSEDDISKQPHNSIDAAFSSYVFHLISEDESLRILYKVLKAGGILAANFHKNIGKNSTNRYLMQLGFKVLELSNFTARKWHGSYGVYIKPK